ncbi:PIN domain-containing protein [Frankia sp. Cj3]|uniref:PIN domain-containing protein n=1 Tax=Frankia sp. Cj3 TaxID=2880976 RepID=UPI00351D1C46
MPEAPRQDQPDSRSRPRLRLSNAAAQRLVTALNRAFPFAEVEPAEEDFRALAGVWLPDEDDRHVLAAAVAAQATVLCTWNVKDFPADTAAVAGIEVLTPDELLCRLVAEYEPQMLAAHRTAVASLTGGHRQVDDHGPAPSRGFDNRRSDESPHRRLLNLRGPATHRAPFPVSHHSPPGKPDETVGASEPLSDPHSEHRAYGTV